MCTVNRLTGLYCPGCGMTRAVISALNGELYQALRYNPWFVPTIPMVLIMWLMLYRKYRGALVKFMQVYMFCTIAFGFLRNIPLFEFLAPTAII